MDVKSVFSMGGLWIAEPVIWSNWVMAVIQVWLHVIFKSVFSRFDHYSYDCSKRRGMRLADMSNGCRKKEGDCARVVQPICECVTDNKNHIYMEIWSIYIVMVGWWRCYGFPPDTPCMCLLMYTNKCIWYESGAHVDTHIIHTQIHMLMCITLWKSTLFSCFVHYKYSYLIIKQKSFIEL